MSRKRKKLSESVGDNIMTNELVTVVMALKRQLEARKKVYFRYKGIVMTVREVPDHDTQLRAAVELMKIMGLYPRG